jgi:rhodanese-related sulfurtransferase
MMKIQLFYLGIIALLLFALLVQGRATYRLSRSLAQEVIPQEAYANLRKAPSNKQVIDTRSLEEYEEGHLPGALNLVGGAFTEDAGLDFYKETIVVSEKGDTDLFKALSQHFKVTRNLADGMLGWRMSRLPEESQTYDLAALKRGPAG